MEELRGNRIALCIMKLAGVAAAYSSATVEKDIREFFRAERLRLKLTQAEVSEEGDVDQSTVSRIERDPPYDPGIKSFLCAIRGLGMNPSEFFARFEQRTGSATEIIARSQKEVLRPQQIQTHNPASPQGEVAFGSSGPHPTTRVEEILSTFIENSDRVVASIERLAKAGRQKPQRRAPVRPRRRKAS